MTRGRARTHVDATKPGDLLRRALCSWIDVDTDTDVSKVDCKSCLTLLAKGRKNAATRVTPGSVPSELLELLEPKAPSPPRITPATWNASCRGGEHRRCGDCELCVWEREADKWEHAAPDRFVVTRPVNQEAPRWASLDAALRAWAEGSPAALKSQLGGMIDRKASGGMHESYGTPLEALAIRVGLELKPIGKAVRTAYDGGRNGMSASACEEALLLRTPGCSQIMWGAKNGDKRPTYDDLAKRYSVTPDAVQAAVKFGRRVVGLSLFEWGLIPKPRDPRANAARTAISTQEII